MDTLRDYQAWLRQYDDPGSDLSWRLRTVQRYLAEELDARPGAVRILSACAGDGRDVIGVLAGRDDAGRIRQGRVEAALLELHPDIADQARAAATAAGLDRVRVHTVDAGHTDAYAGLVPAEVVLLVGIFGNVSRADLHVTLDTAPQFCSPGALLVWSRGLGQDDLNGEIRARLAARGFDELSYEERGTAALGAVRFSGEPAALVPGRRLFTFRR